MTKVDRATSVTGVTGVTRATDAVVPSRPRAERTSGERGVRRCVVLAGGLQASRLQSVCDSSVLDLPLASGRSVLDLVLERIAELPRPAGVPLEVRVVYGEPVPAPASPGHREGIAAQVVREPKRWRGPAGVILDQCEDLPPEADVLVLEGSRWFASPLTALVEEHATRGGEVTIAQSPDLTPAGAYVLRRSVLEKVPRVGFLDLKEQLLGKLLAEERAMYVHTLAPPGAFAIRTLEDLLETARYAAGGRPEWRVVDPRADVNPAALVLSSIVMAGAVVGAGAILARSVVLPGARVPDGAEVIDSVVGPGGVAREPGRFLGSTKGQR